MNLKDYVQYNQILEDLKINDLDKSKYETEKDNYSLLVKVAQDNENSDKKIVALIYLVFYFQ